MPYTPAVAVGVYPVRKALLEICVGVPVGKNVPDPVTFTVNKGLPCSVAVVPLKVTS